MDYYLKVKPLLVMMDSLSFLLTNELKKFDRKQKKDERSQNEAVASGGEGDFGIAHEVLVEVVALSRNEDGRSEK